MKLGGIYALQIALGGLKPDGQPVISESFAKALKKAAGFTARIFDVQEVKSWWKKNPNFKITDAYPRKINPGAAGIGRPQVIRGRRRNRPNPPASTVGKQNEPLSTHA